MKSQAWNRLRTVAKLAVVVLLLGAGTTAQAERVKGTVYMGLSGVDLQRIMQNLGYRAELDHDSDGDPLIRTSMNRVSVSIFFYNCDASRTCNNIQFSVGLDLANGTTHAHASDYNASWIFGRVSLDDEFDPWLRMTHNVANGVTEGNIEYTIDAYSDALETFMEHFNFNPA